MARKHSGTSDQLAIREANDAPRTLSIESSSFQSNRPIPRSCSEYGDGLSPELHWDRVPDRTLSFVLLMEDPDAPRPQPFVHWVMYNIPSHVHGLPQSLPHDATLAQLDGAMQGRTSAGNIGYFGPRPPKGHGPHHYHFEIFALDSPLDLAPGMDRDQVLRAMRGHVLACGDLVGTFTPPES